MSTPARRTGPALLGLGIAAGFVWAPAPALVTGYYLNDYSISCGKSGAGPGRLFAGVFAGSGAVLRDGSTLRGRRRNRSTGKR